MAPSQKSLKSKIILSCIIIVLLLLVGAPGYYFYMQYQRTQQMLQNPTEVVKQETKDLITRVGLLIELPKNEDPRIATVSDKTKLQGQVFFARAENGDKVLIYVNAKKAILYRPSTNKIIDVTNVNINGEAQAQAQVVAQTPTPSAASISATPVPKTVKVVLYNGTKVSGLASKVEKELQQKASYVTVVAKGNSIGDYTKTLVVDLGSNKKVATDLATLLGGEVGTMPKTETKPTTADILIILGPQQ